MNNLLKNPLNFVVICCSRESHYSSAPFNLRTLFVFLFVIVVRWKTFEFLFPWNKQFTLDLCFQYISSLSHKSFIFCIEGLLFVLDSHALPLDPYHLHSFLDIPNFIKVVPKLVLDPSKQVRLKLLIFVPKHLSILQCGLSFQEISLTSLHFGLSNHISWK